MQVGHTTECIHAIRPIFGWFSWPSRRWYCRTPWRIRGYCELGLWLGLSDCWLYCFWDFGLYVYLRIYLTHSYPHPFFTIPSSLFHSRALFTSGLVIPITNLHLPSHALSQHRTTYLNFVSRYLRANSPSSHQISSISYNLPFHFHELVFPVFPSWFPHPPRHFFMLITNAGGWITLPCSCVCIYAHTIFLLLPSFSRVLIPYYPLGETCGRCASQIEYTYGIMSVC